MKARTSQCHRERRSSRRAPDTGVQSRARGASHQRSDGRTTAICSRRPCALGLPSAPKESVAAEKRRSRDNCPRGRGGPHREQHSPSDLHLGIRVDPGSGSSEWWRRDGRNCWALLRHPTTRQMIRRAKHGGICRVPGAGVPPDGPERASVAVGR